jgi:diphosphomevalonate decarboxylase
MTNQIFSSAPSNIALIKYMGKSSTATNVPANASLSYTLESLRTYVSLQTSPAGSSDVWATMTESGFVESSLTDHSAQRTLEQGKIHFSPLEMSEKSIEKFLKHLTFLKREFQIEENFLISSGNNFPSDAGLASSASAFAALTKCFFEWMMVHQPASLQKKLQQVGKGLVETDLAGTDMTLVDLMSSYSRRGSGSSCRSFYSPWSLWDQTKASSFESVYRQLNHFAIVVSAEKKEVSSSRAHEMVLSSPHFKGRVQRAQVRIEKLQSLLNKEDQDSWASSYQICWEEFMDMHELFHTCQQPFRYMTPMTEKALVEIQKLWAALNDGPLVTMDAGPNIHFLFRQDQDKLKKLYVQELSKYGYLIASKPAQPISSDHD